MFIPDMPNVAVQDQPVMIAQANQARAGSVALMRTIGVCAPAPNHSYSLENVIEPIYSSQVFLRELEKRNLTGPATVTILQHPKHGVLRAVTQADVGTILAPGGAPVDSSNPGYFYLPEFGYVGKDSATILVDFGSVKVTVKYFFQAINGPVGDNWIEDYCIRTGPYWKISSTLGTAGNITINTTERIPADTGLHILLTSDFATGYLANYLNRAYGDINISFSDAGGMRGSGLNF